MSRFHVNIEKPQSARLQCRIHSEGEEISFCASYTPRDSFDDLVRSVRALYEFGTLQKVEINEEPEVAYLLLTKENDHLVVEKVNDRGASLGKVTSPFRSDCREFARRFKFLLQEVGYEGFVSEWRHRPPKEEIKRLWENFA